MKKSTKLISLILAVVMVFSASSFSALAAIPSAAQNSVETLIQNRNLADLVGWLITNLNGAKTNVTGTVLRLVYEFAGDNIGGEGKDTYSMSDEQLAKTLLDWLDANLPEWTSDLTEQSWWDTVTGVVNFLGVTLDLKSVNGIINTVYSVCNKVNTDPIIGAAVGDLKNLNGSALKGVSRNDGNLKVIYALLQWINDNQGFIKSFIIGGIGDNGIKLGSLVDRFIGGNLDDINKIVKNIPDFAKGWVYLLVDPYADKPDIKDNPKGGWGASPYAGYSADEMLASALINVVNGKNKSSRDDNLTVVPQADAKEVLGLSFYGLLAKYGDQLYNRFALEPLNNQLKNFLNEQGASYPEIAENFKSDYVFTETTFSAVFKDAGANGFLGQMNNILCTIFDVMLTDTAKANVKYEKGGNDKLNGNLASLCRYVLPILAKYSDKMGFDFTKFTADTVKDMELPEMAVAVLKIFFPTWFKDNYDAALVNKAQTIAQLGLAAIKFVVTNTNWITLDNDFSAKEFTDEITADKIDTYSDNECVELIVSIGAKLGAYTLDAANGRTHFTLDKTASANWTWKEYCDEIVDWAINFAKGLPAVAVNHITAERGKYDGNGPFYKVNVILNELIDFAFLSNVKDATFKLDTETLIFDTILNNAFNFDIAAIVGVFEKNTNAGNILDGKVIPGVIGLVDRLLTALFNHTCGASASFEKELSCTEAITGNYDTKNGHYVGAVATKAIDTHQWVEKPENNKEATCKDQGSRFFECAKCGETKEEPIPATGDHDYQEVSRQTMEDGTIVVKLECTKCHETKNDIIEPDPSNPDNPDTPDNPDNPDNPDTPDNPTESEVPANLADVDGNGEIESGDARLALRASVKLEDIKEGTDAFKAADVDGNGTIESSDARLILRLSVKLEKMEDLKAKYGK